MHKNIIKMKRRRRRRGQRGRQPSPVYIAHDPEVLVFNPHPEGTGESILLEHDELEVLRLVDLEGLSQEEAGNQMEISRGTIWRLLQRARKKIILALVNGRQIRIITE